MADEPQFFQKDDTTGDFVPASLPTFHESLPETIREHEHLKDMDLAKLSQDYVDLRSNQPQIPDNPDGYEVPELPEGLKIDEEAVKGFRALAHELKIPAEAFQKILEFDFKRMQSYEEADRQAAEEAANEIKKNREAAQTELDKKWGSEKDAKMELVSKVRKRFITEEMEKAFNDSGLGDCAYFNDLLAMFGEVIDEDQLILPDTRQQSGDIPRTVDGRPMLDYSKVDR